MVSADRARRRRPPILSGLRGDKDDCEGDDVVDDDDVETKGGGIGGATQEGCLAGVAGIASLERRTHRDAQESMMTKAAPFHNFILEWVGALKLCKTNRNRRLGAQVPFYCYSTSSLLSPPVL